MAEPWQTGGGPPVPLRPAGGPPDLSLPPLLTGHLSTHPRADALAAAQSGCDSGALFWHPGPHLNAVVLLAPDIPLAQAVQTAPLAAIALRDALGAIGPAEVPIHLDWTNSLLIDGLASGQVRAIAPADDPDTPPDWLALHATLTLSPDAPLASLSHTDLIESWSRHLLHWLTRWEEDGAAALHGELDAAAWERETKDPAWIGRDEALGRLRRDGAETKLDPLTDLLETP